MRGLAWTCLLLFVLLLLQSVVVPPSIPLPIRFLVVGVGLLTALRPSAGLVALAALGPLSYALAYSIVSAYGDWTSLPLNLPEALVLAFFAGYLLAHRRTFVNRSEADDSIARATRLFVCAVALSALGQLRVLQIWHDFPLHYMAELFRFVARDYLTTIVDPRPWVDGRRYLGVAALLIEGVVLMRCTRRLCDGRPDVARAVGAALVGAGAVAAILAFKQPFDVSRETGRSLAAVIAAQRWSTPAIPSLNTAGPYFLLTTFLGAALALERGWSTPLGGAAAAATLAAMWLTKTRSSIVAGVAALVSLAVWLWVRRRFSPWPHRRLAAIAAAAALAAALAVVVFNPFQILQQGSTQSLRFRLLFAETGVRMLSSAPLAGVGVGQYEPRYFDFASPELLRLDRRINNAHNYLLWLAAELGIVGAGVFVWLMIAALRRASRQIGGARRWPRMVAFVGILAFLLTWSIGQPIGLHTAAIPFWIAVGMATAADLPRRAAAAPSTLRLPGRVALAALYVFFAAALPVRVATAVSEIDFSRVSYGFYQSDTSADGVRFRWGGPRIRLYQRSTVPAVDMTLATLLDTMPDGVRLLVDVDGRRFETVRLDSGEWRELRVSPASNAWRTARFWRIDLTVVPEGHAANVPDEGRRIAIGPIQRVATWETAR